MDRISKVPVHWLRMVFYRHIFKMLVDKNVVVDSYGHFSKPTGITIGKACIIGDNCWIDGRGVLHILVMA